MNLRVADAHCRATSPLLRPVSSITRAPTLLAQNRSLARSKDRCVEAGASAHYTRADASVTDARASLERQHETTKDDVIRRFFEAFNRRDIFRMAECVADDCEHCNLAYPAPFRGKHAVVEFYKDFMKVVPNDASFEIEDTTGGGDSASIGVIWHLQMHGTVIPNSTGVSFFRLDASNRIAYVRESPEHFAKIADLAIPSLSLISPLVELAQPLLRPQGKTNSAPLYSSRANPGHNPSYSDPSAPRSHFTSGERARAPAVFPDPMALVHQAASNTLARWSQSASPPPPPPPPAPAAAPAPHTPTDRGPPQVTIAEARRQAATADLDEPLPARPHPFASIFFRKQPPRDATMRPLQHTAAPATDPPRAAAPQHTAPQHAASQAAGPAGDEEALNHITGVWQKERSLSQLDEYGRCLDLMGVRGLQKATAIGIEGIEVNADAEAGILEVFYLTPVPFYKVKEAFRLDRETESGRRDLRGGRQSGRARWDGGRAIVDVAWGEPYGGQAHEEYWLDDMGRLCAQSTVTVGGRSATTLQVYNRQDAAATDQRYYAAKQSIPFGVDANQLSDSMLGNLLK
eukprot:jgi/Ulvmu1/6429/UM003_0058.1